MFRTVCRAALCAGLVAGVASAASAQDEEDTYLGNEADLEGDPELGEVSHAPTSIPGPLTVFGGVRLGLGGEAQADPGGEDDMISTLGLQGGADYVIMDYFAIGGELRISAWGTDFQDDADNGRSLLFDFVARPRGRYVFEGMPLEAYGTLPLGLSIPSINDDWSADGAAGFTLGIGAGANYFVSDRLGFGGELIYMKHWIGIETNFASGVVGRDYDLSLGQINFVGNVIYAL